MSERFRYGFTIGSRIGSGVVRFRFGVVQDGLAASHFLRVLAAHGDLVTAFR